MTPPDEKLRVVIALTETSCVFSLWQAAIERSAHAPADLVALFLADERLQRAASLHFTREFPKIGGTPLDFTLQRAEKIGRETARQARQHIEKLAAEAGAKVAFEFLSEPDRSRLSEIIGGQQSLLIAPEIIAARPIYVHFIELGCRIELIRDPGDYRRKLA